MLRGRWFSFRIEQIYSTDCTLALFFLANRFLRFPLLVFRFPLSFKLSTPMNLLVHTHSLVYLYLYLSLYIYYLFIMK